MHASLPKQVAYNQRILKAGEETDGINYDRADFLAEMSLNHSDPGIVCVDAGDSMKRHEQHGGQLWLQGDRSMTATNVLPDGMSNDATSAALVAVAEAVEWKHTFEPEGVKRLGRRVAIYPPTLDKPEEVLASGDTSLDPEASHDIAYERILAACASFENPPGFFSSDSQDFGGLDIVERVPKWMHTAKEISIGGRRQVLEDGNDVCDSESDSDNEDHGEKLTGIYTPEIPVGEEGRPLNSAYKLSNDQSNAMRVRARCSEEFKGSPIQASAAGSCEPSSLNPAFAPNPP
jgi:hypothetical protein